MKKVLGIIALLLLIFIILIYWSLNSKPGSVENSILVNIDNIDTVNFHKYDSILIEATNRYEGNNLKKLMQGEHYRKAWSTPIKVPVIFLDTLYGGLTITKEGGGNQTESLKLVAPNGIYYTLRSINKNPDALIPEFAKKLGLENIVVDGISAQHPYGAMIAAALAEKVGVLHTYPKVVFVPKQKAFGDYDEKYGNRLFLLEYESESTTNWTHYNNVIEILDTDDLQELKMNKGKFLTIDAHALVRARLFDLVIGDWDRHSKQWAWVLQKKGDSLNAIPLPMDRDNAFFNLGGIIPNLIANKNVRPEVQAFRNDIDYLPGLVQPFDVYFLQTIPEAVFSEEALKLQHLLTDDAIDSALHVWPKNIYDLDAKDIAEKLRSRRDLLPVYAKAFKKILDEQEVLTQPLKGSEDLKLPQNLLACFECNVE
ncbi:MAG: hypothetical protein ACSHXF_07665 [Aquaticitalea sp.]